MNNNFGNQTYAQLAAGSAPPLPAATVSGELVEAHSLLDSLGGSIAQLEGCLGPVLVVHPENAGGADGACALHGAEAVQELQRLNARLRIARAQIEDIGQRARV